jgi:hypothetical protein
LYEVKDPNCIFIFNVYEAMFRIHFGGGKSREEAPTKNTVSRGANT